MTKDELNSAVFDKMNEEMKRYVEYLYTLSPEKLLNQCQEYVIKQDILSVMETTTLPEDQARALLAEQYPLDAVYIHFYDAIETNYLDGITDAIQEKAKSLYDKYREPSTIPVYTHALSHAKESNMVDDYMRSHKLNVACKTDIDTAIKTFYRNNTLDEEAVQSVIAKYGFPRTIYVLANTMQHKQWDGRFSPENRVWVESIPLPPDIDTMGYDRRLEYVTQSHSGLIDIFSTSVRKQYLQQLEVKEPQRVKPSVRAKLRSPAPKRNSPNYSANKKGRSADHGRA